MNLIEQARRYSAANGGHATVADSIGTSLAHFTAVVSGKVPVSRQVAAGMAPLIGCTVTALLREDSDLQLALMRNRAA